MMGSYNHNNPWAEKLQDISLPEADGAWMAMSEALDREMPQRPGRDRRRWFLLIILLLLLLGICNCPGRWKRGEEQKDTGTETVGTEPGKPLAVDGSGIKSSRRQSKDQRKNQKKSQKKNLPKKGIHEQDRRSGNDGSSDGSSGKDHPLADDPNKPADNTPATIPGIKDSISDKQKDTVLPDGKSPLINDPVRSSKKKKDSLNKKDNLIDSKPEDKKKEKQHRERWWAAGIGLNQFFTLGQQQGSDYNSGGTTGHLGDYLPVPMLRFYFNEKLFIQLEAQFNTPQYTKKNLLVQQTYTLDTSNPLATVTRQNSVYIKKLFYFNVPLSVHYSPFKNAYIGTGLQYSRLSNGVGLFGDNTNTGGVADTVKVVKSLKSDPVYQSIKTYEFRWLLDMSYTYKHFVFGLRYNQALSKFIDVRISTTQQVVQSRNSSLQLYLRYILWDSRGKKDLLPPK